MPRARGPAPPTAALELRGAAKRYGDDVVLDGLDIAFPAGRTTVLIGPSGCGKSTILRLLNGPIRPGAGSVWFEGEPLDALDPLVRHELPIDLEEILRALGKSVVLVTYDLAEAAHFGEDVVLIDRGRIVQRGRMRDLVGRPANELAARFVRAQRAHFA